MTFVNNIAGLNLFDDLCVIIIQRTAAFVAFLNGGVKTGLLDVPLGDLQMLVNVHDCFSCLVRGVLSSTYKVQYMGFIKHGNSKMRKLKRIRR